MENLIIHPSWKKVLVEEFEKEYFHKLIEFLIEEEKSGIQYYPPAPLIFNAFNSTPFDKVKVVILGQDPYHGEGQAQGLSFSVPKSKTCPPSLKNIYKELNSSLDIPVPKQGDLGLWAEEGVLLLNSILTVRAKFPGSHQKKGWELFTDAAINALNDQKEKLVFLLWGKYAQEKGRILNHKKHLVLTSSHPSPFSAHRGFLGNGHFKKTNDYLVANNISPINWSIIN